MPIDKDIYSIYAVRLVNFHNINHVTIPVRNGGHLFLLGDNGSGKTTVLDAIHYILSAGEQVELNSAARLGGNKADGRRINGVVTRLNVDTGPLCPEGRVTYAALELRNSNGNCLCIGIGLSIAGVNAPLQQWGFRIDSTIEELPILCRDDTGNEYPPNRNEFKNIVQKLNGRYYTSMSLFANALSSDFFPTSSQYEEYRKFLNMCKAYREISSKAGNYHELFKSLLPEPESETLQSLRLSLKDLRESSSTLTLLEKRCDYLRKIFEEKQKIDRLREEINFFELGILYFDNEKQRQLWNSACENALSMAQNLELKLRNKEQMQKRSDELSRALTDLKSRDASSLIETEKSRSRELDLLEQKRSTAEKRRDALVTQAQKNATERQTHLQDFSKNLSAISGKLAENLAVWPELPLKAALDAVQTAQVAENAYQTLALNPLRELQNAFGGATERAKVVLNTTGEFLSHAQLEHDEAKNTLALLQKQSEAYPESLHDYADMLDSLAQRMLMVTPLYLKLHWKRSIPPSIRSAVEELIGEAVLATLVAEADQTERIREQLLQEEAYGFRVAALEWGPEKQPSSRIYEFLEHYFDVSKDAQYLVVLARELDGGTIPVLESANPVRFADWRGSTRILYGLHAKLIGEEERKAEQQRRIADAKEILQYKVSLLRQAEKRQLDADRRLKALRRFEERYRQLFSTNESQRDALLHCDRELQNNAKDSDENNQIIVELNRTHADYQLLLERLRTQIKAQNLQALDAEIKIRTEQFQSAQKQSQDAHDEWNAQKTRSDDQALKVEELRRSAESASDIFNEAIDNSNFCHTLDALRKHLLGNGIENKIQCSDKIAVLKQTAASSDGFIRSQITGSEGIDYGFTYDSVGNELFSREHRTLGDILERLQSELIQQRQILTEETRRNFERILLEQFRDSLRKKIYGLEHMHSLINRILKGHSFGRNTYSLKIEPLPDYAALVEVMKSFSDQTPESAEKLKEIFAMHANEILETPANQVPPILDYRNYFRYEMLLHSEGANGRVMDTRTKSVGSGGEQAVPNYLLVMMIAHLLFDKAKGTNSRIKINTVLFDEAFYGIDQQRQDQLLSFAEELGLQLMIASPNQDGIKPELANSTNVFVRKDKDYQVHLFCYNYQRDKPLLVDENELSPGAELS